MTTGAADIGTKRDLTFVTITFRDELDLLRLQARSMAAFLPPSMVGEILVVVNDRDEAAVAAEVEAMRGDYGPLADRLRVVAGTALFRWDVGPGGPLHWLRRAQAWHPRLAFRSPGTAWRGHGGWKIQQVCKMAVYREVTTDWTVLLDSKIHFLNPVSPADFFSATGQPRLICNPREEAREDWLAPSFRQFGLTPADAGPRVVNGIMPLPIRTRLLGQVTEAVEERAGPLQVLFAVHRQGETEAMLINAYCVAEYGSLEAEFDTARPLPPVIMRTTTSELIDVALDRVAAGEATLALHRASVARLTAAQRGKLVALWRRAGLVGSEAEAAAFLDGAPLAGVAS
ncbi:DUF6492 family protein [Pseudooceanicola sp. LIPI14-2-Ac024]|uniref:DUF6492 family protein n=1 Tax=Pseudooceanicola sp. LIPI14-2-Ac024 TaxID=3344875 RepID=UPI0035CF1A89